LKGLLVRSNQSDRGSWKKPSELLCGGKAVFGSNPASATEGFPFQMLRDIVRPSELTNAREKMFGRFDIEEVWTAHARANLVLAHGLICSMGVVQDWTFWSWSHRADRQLLSRASQKALPIELSQAGS
jgi:hypothetical protein